ncbi:hypothetical protein SAMN02910447_00249 [Ruminococcus sp. YE71]|nr:MULTISPECIES: hypothetical protein [unclassified Ruminococcus]SDA09451.1 hypothetical protein SAMN02910446_00100 [Ruminococcus sp. YE78]SFW12245.1 hypothetical protein SAMN02910447_00249 [Ruminococcus sp. YE71]
MKTAEKIFIAIGIITSLCAVAAVIVHFVCAGNKKYYPVSKTTVEV